MKSIIGNNNNKNNNIIPIKEKTKKKLTANLNNQKLNIQNLQTIQSGINNNIENININRNKLIKKVINFLLKFS